MSQLLQFTGSVPRDPAVPHDEAVDEARHVDMSPDSRDTHLWVFWMLLIVGVLAWAAVAGARRRP